MANGKTDDHPLTDVLKYRKRVFGEDIDSLIVKVYSLSRYEKLDEIDWFQKQKSGALLKTLQIIHDELLRTACENGWGISHRRMKASDTGHTTCTFCNDASSLCYC